VKRQLGYLALAALALGVAIWIVIDEGDELTAVAGPLVGVYRIADAQAGPPGAMVARPELAGRAFVVLRDGPELAGGLCPDEIICRRWLTEPAAFRHALPSLPVDAALPEADPETLLASAHVLGTEAASTVTTADNRCRRRIDSGALEPTEIGLRLHRELAQTELVEDCEARRATERIVLELDLVRLDIE
jgi:hypothetical protein